MKTLSKRELKILRIRLEQSLLDFTRYFFKEVLGYKMMVTDHHRLLAHTLERVDKGEIKRLVINMPPGYTKTELAVIAFIAWSIAKNPKSRFIHATYSDKLALENSTRVRDIITSPEFQAIWPMALRADSKAKGAWKIKGKGGGMQARAAGGPITGFRAGQPPEEGEDPANAKFSGAFIIDDPLKPDDATSILRVDTINDRFNKVFRSRLMREKDTPLILIMQRISDNDPSAYLLDGGMNEDFHHLCLPALIDKKTKRKKYKRCKPIQHKLPDGPLWEWKHTEAKLKELEEADPYTYAAQYRQEPVPLGGGMFKEPWFKYYKLGGIIPSWRFITVDTAQKTKEKNDYSVFALWGVHEGKLYLMDLIRGKWEAPELLINARQFWLKHFSPASPIGRLRFMAIEDKASGTGLIQQLQRETNPPIPVTAIQRSTDKVSRAMDNVPYVASGKLFLPENAAFTLDYKAELLQFTASLTHRFDDQVDVTCDAIELGLAPPKKQAGAF